MHSWEIGETIHETFLLADSDGVRLAGLAVASIEAATRLYRDGALVGTFAALGYCSVTDLGDARYKFATDLVAECVGGEYDWFVDSDDFASLDGLDYQSGLHRVGFDATLANQTVMAAAIAAVADQVWDEAAAGHVTAGTTGAKLSASAAPVDIHISNTDITS